MEVQKRYPEKFQKTKLKSNVSSATRSTSPKRVKLTASEIRIANKFGLTHEQYAKEKLRLGF
jgi:phage I-like protein